MNLYTNQITLKRKNNQTTVESFTANKLLLIKEMRKIEVYCREQMAAPPDIIGESERGRRLSCE